MLRRGSVSGTGGEILSLLDEPCGWCDLDMLVEECACMA